LLYRSTGRKALGGVIFFMGTSARPARRPTRPTLPLRGAESGTAFPESATLIFRVSGGIQRLPVWLHEFVML